MRVATVMIVLMFIGLSVNSKKYESRKKEECLTPPGTYLLRMLSLFAFCQIRAVLHHEYTS